MIIAAEPSHWNDTIIPLVPNTVVESLVQYVEYKLANKLLGITVQFVIARGLLLTVECIIYVYNVCDLQRA